MSDLPAPRAVPGTPEWARWCVELSAQKGYPICGRKNRRGEPCTKSPSKGRDCCRNHGGATLTGTAAPNYKHGRRSRYAAAGRLLGSYQHQMEDLEYVSLREDLAAITALLEEQWQVLDQPLPTNVTPEELKTVQQTRDVAYRKFRELMNDRNRLSRTETRRIQVAEDSLSGQQVRIFSQTVLESVRRNVRDLVEEMGGKYDMVLRTMGRIQDDVMRAMAASSNRGQEAGRDDLDRGDELV
jgi:hypothetical protein